ncbi:MAG: YqjK-like family protein [Candidatus Dasytiphilus stammeri]
MNLYDEKNHTNKLLCTIQQQRIKLATECNELIAASKKYEHLLYQLLKIRYTLIILSSMITIFLVRHPRLLIRLSKKSFAIWKIYKTMQNFLMKK